MRVCEGMRARVYTSPISALSYVHYLIYIYIYITDGRQTGQLKYLRRDTPSLSLAPQLHFPLFPSFVLRSLYSSDGTIDPGDIEKIFIAVNAITGRARGLIRNNADHGDVSCLR